MDEETKVTITLKVVKNQVIFTVEDGEDNNQAAKNLSIILGGMMDRLEQMSEIGYGSGLPN